MMSIKHFALPLLLALAQTGFAQPKAAEAPPAKAAGGQAVMLYAAASTANAIKEIDALFTKTTGIEVETSFGASSTLAQQIAQGARANVFLSANELWALDVAHGGLTGEIKNLVTNKLVAIVPADSKLSIKKPEDLAAADVHVLAMADPSAVPAGIYGKQALTKLGLWDKVATKATGSADVRQALAVVERGEAEAGIVYATDAAISKKVRTAFEFDPKLTDPIVYPAVLLRAGTSADARKYFDFLAGPEAAAIFKKYGFAPAADKKPEDDKAQEKGQDKGPAAGSGNVAK